MAAYAEEKQRIFRGDGAVVLNVDDEWVAAMALPERRHLRFSIQKPADFYLENKPDASLMFEDQSLMLASELPLEGSHNIANALAALALGYAVGLDLDAMCNALKTFKGLPHRMQKVAQIKGVTWVNDSKATNIGATVAALQGYQHKVVLLAGGDAKGADMAELAPIVQAKCQSVVVMGKDADLISHAVESYVPVFYASNMREAVAIAAQQAQSGETVLLSPACASLDQYKSYADRGNKFSEAVMELLAC